MVSGKRYGVRQQIRITEASLRSDFNFASGAIRGGDDLNCRGASLHSGAAVASGLPGARGTNERLTAQSNGAPAATTRP